MNRRSFTNTLLAEGILVPRTSLALLAGSAGQAGGTYRLPSALSRTLDIGGRAAILFGLAGPNGAPGLSLRASEAVRLGLVDPLTARATTAQNP